MESALAGRRAIASQAPILEACGIDSLPSVTTEHSRQACAAADASITSAESGVFIRDHLLSLGSILYVHELPSYTFPNVEARVYLLEEKAADAADAEAICEALAG